MTAKCIKFMDIPNAKDVSALMTEIGRKLNYTLSKFEKIKGVYKEETQLEKYNLYVYACNDELNNDLKNIIHGNESQTLVSLQLNELKIRVKLIQDDSPKLLIALMQENDAMKEKVIQFSSSPTRTLFDVLLMISTKRYPIKFSITDDEKTCIGFKNGTDVLCVINNLRCKNIEAQIVNCSVNIEQSEAQIPQVPMDIEPTNNENNAAAPREQRHYNRRRRVYVRSHQPMQQQFRGHTFPIDNPRSFYQSGRRNNARMRMNERNIDRRVDRRSFQTRNLTRGRYRRGRNLFY
jgi:hypothetical protein